MDAPLTRVADDGPLAATLLADALLEQTWTATAPETWFASPFIVVLTYALAIALREGKGAADTIARLTTAVRSRLDARAAVVIALTELRALAGARTVVVAVDGVSSPTMLFVQTDRESGTRNPMPRTLAPGERSAYFFETPPAPNTTNGVAPFELSGTNVPPAFRHAHAFRKLVGFAIRAGEWHGRLFLLDPMNAAIAGPVLQDYNAILRQLLPATTRVCDLHAQRHRAEARERARLGRELHDGIVQELACLDVELELIGVTAAAQHGGIRERIARIQERLRAELSTLRKLLQDARFRDLDSARLQSVLESMVERFGRDTRMHADYVSDVSEVRLPPHVCGEIARIVQEALVNVRRHSGARHVVVTFSCDSAEWRLSIQDDGRGFGAGRPLRTDANRRTPLPPTVIYERVHSLGGTVRVVAPGPSGARIEISGHSGKYGTG